MALEKPTSTESAVWSSTSWTALFSPLRSGPVVILEKKKKNKKRPFFFSTETTLVS